MEDKYPRESDFYKAYVNTKIIHYLNLPSSYRVLKASKVNLDCINLDKTTMVLSNCNKAKEIVENFFDQNPEIQEVKTNVLENCSEKLHKLYIASNLDKTSNLTRVVNNEILTSNKNIFMKCLRRSAKNINFRSSFQH